MRAGFLLGGASIWQLPDLAPSVRALALQLFRSLFFGGVLRWPSFANGSMSPTATCSLKLPEELDGLGGGAGDPESTPSNCAKEGEGESVGLDQGESGSDLADANDMGVEKPGEFGGEEPLKLPFTFRGLRFENSWGGGRRGGNDDASYRAFPFSVGTRENELEVESVGWLSKSGPRDDADVLEDIGPRSELFGDSD
jgi:hypothetical protein